MVQGLPPRDVAAVFDAQPDLTAQGMALLRRLIIGTAQADPPIGPLSETLKWGQPAYRPLRPRTGTTLRVGKHKDAAFALFAPCRTNVIDTHAQRCGDTDPTDGNRAILFHSLEDIDSTRLRPTILYALMYFLPDDQV